MSDEKSIKSADDSAPPAGAAISADRTLELPMRLLGRTVKRTRDALDAMAPGEVLALHTDDP